MRILWLCVYFILCTISFNGFADTIMPAYALVYQGQLRQKYSRPYHTIPKRQKQRLTHILVRNELYDNKVLRKWFDNNKKIHGLYLENIDITEDKLKVLEDILIKNKIENLIFKSCKFTHSSEALYSLLQRYTNIKALHLINNQLSFKAMKLFLRALRQQSDLMYLELSQQVGIKAYLKPLINTIFTIDSLEYLYLRRNGFSNNDAIFLARSLLRFYAVDYLYLDGNDFAPEYVYYLLKFFGSNDQTMRAIALTLPTCQQKNVCAMVQNIKAFAYRIMRNHRRLVILKRPIRHEHHHV